jgi:hypothetical protein
MERIVNLTGFGNLSGLKFEGRGKRKEERV